MPHCGDARAWSVLQDGIAIAERSAEIFGRTHADPYPLQSATGSKAEVHSVACVARRFRFIVA